MNPSSQLHAWYSQNGRKFDWRDEKSPYRIWIREIILQQTRIEQGISYYEQFISLFPDVFSLASASSDAVMKAWEGLGYYSRARNLHHAAQTVVTRLNGVFPHTAEDLIRLKGIGPYTARAIASMAFNQPVAVLDGNVSRVITRYLADPSPVDKISTKKSLLAILDGWISGAEPAVFNQAMMDIGSIICTPRKPACGDCPLSNNCRAFRRGTMHDFPVKAGKLKRKEKFFQFSLISHDDQILIRKRPEEGLWGGLWEVPNRELQQKDWKKLSSSYTFKHVFTHFDMHIKVAEEQVSYPPGDDKGLLIHKNKIGMFAFSKAVLKIFERCI